MADTLDPRYAHDDRDYSSQDVYESVLQAVRARCNEMQGPGPRLRQLGHSLWGQYSRYERTDVLAGIQAAIQNGDLVKWTDTEGMTRYTVAEEDELQRLVGYMNRHEYDPETISRVAEAIQEVRDDG